MKYRSDIDGLRSLAIIPVVLCHLGVASFAGGFVGVDVFFFISGYLIGRILLEETADGTFSLTRFYERRIRRILPALMAMVLGSFALAWFLFLPDEMMLFGKTAVAALLSYSNFHFNATADYFAAPAKANPLLHTWSLAVEEQFYVVFPLLLLAWKKWSNDRRVLIGLIAVLMVASITISAIGANARDTSAFYLPHSRAWELLAGVVLALGIIPEWRNRWLRHGASLLGIGLICYAIATFHEGMKFPGLNALYPVLGTMLIIHAGQGGVSFGGRILSLKPLVGIGLVSYSWYLWHWPLIVFFRSSYHPAIAALQPYEVPLLLAVSFALAVLSWLWVERPFRGHGGMVRFPRRRLFAYSAVAMVLLVGAMGSVWKLAGGLPQRFPAGAYGRYQLNMMPPEFIGNPCVFQKAAGAHVTIESIKECAFLQKDKQNFFVIGDSHSAHWYYGMNKVFLEQNVRFVSMPGCREFSAQAHSKNVCRDFMYTLLHEFLVKQEPATIFIAGFWRGEEGEKIRYAVKLLQEAGHKVVILGATPYYRKKLPELILFSQWHDKSEIVMRRFVDKRAVDKKLSRELRDTGALYVSPHDFFSSAEDVVNDNQGKAFFWDGNHLSDAGSLYFAQKLKEKIKLP